jgi:hypothetical protein
MTNNSLLTGCAANPECVYVGLAREEGLPMLGEQVRLAQVTLDRTPDLGSNKHRALDALDEAQIRRDAFVAGIQAETITCNGNLCNVACAGVRAFIEQSKS